MTLQALGLANGTAEVELLAELGGASLVPMLFRDVAIEAARILKDNLTEKEPRNST